MLADEFRKRVVIVDTSNEIGGDGDVPHAGIGKARRMQVPNVNMQHNVSTNLGCFLPLVDCFLLGRDLINYDLL